MALNINTIVQDTDAFHAQSGPLFVPRRAAHGQADPTTGTQHTMPGQFSVTGQLAQCSPDPAGGATQSRQLGELAVAHDFALGHLCQGQVERRASDLRRAFGFSG